MAKLKTIAPLIAGMPAAIKSSSQSQTERIRGRKGQAMRHRRLMRTNYMCEMCAAKGIMRPADEVDHIVPLAKGGPDADTNTRNLCREHHLQVTAEEFGRVGRGG